MPSNFEPCGLNQMYAMRYGTVPVVHAVGGLRDTVKNFDPFADGGKGAGTGWAYDSASVDALIHATGNAISTYRQYPDSFRGIALRGMASDFSWETAAKNYEELLIEAKYEW